MVTKIFALTLGILVSVLFFGVVSAEIVSYYEGSFNMDLGDGGDIEIGNSTGDVVVGGGDDGTGDNTGSGSSNLGSSGSSGGSVSSDGDSLGTSAGGNSFEQLSDSNDEVNSCGNGICDLHESYSSCPEDCSSVSQNKESGFFSGITAAVIGFGDNSVSGLAIGIFFVLIILIAGVVIWKSNGRKSLK